jgi:predicted Rossmann fold nucleotide-binding protein DprA/Smf involved in DNA uptake
MIMTDTSLATLLLTNRIVDVGVKPLSSAEFWVLQRAIEDPALLAGMSAEDVSAKTSLSPDRSERVAALLEAGTAFAFERERLEEQGVRLVSALDDGFPARLQQRLGDGCPAFLLVAGPIEYLQLPAIGVVGSRDASTEALKVAADAARFAASNGFAIVSGLARGVDQFAMLAALERGAPVIGIPSEGLRVAARNSELRRRVHDGELCMASPYGPSMRFTAGNAMGRNKIIYALASHTLVVCSDVSGGTWEGAKEALRRGFGVVGVWNGQGAGPGNAQLIEMGGNSIGTFEELVAPSTNAVGPMTKPVQTSLFD